MSTDYCIMKPPLTSELLDGRLDKYGVRVHQQQPDENGNLCPGGDICFTDGEENYFWLHVIEGKVTGGTRYYPNGNPGAILHAISEACDTEIYTDNELIAAAEAEEEMQNLI